MWTVGTKVTGTVWPVTGALGAMVSMEAWTKRTGTLRPWEGAINAWDGLRRPDNAAFLSETLV